MSHPLSPPTATSPAGFAPADHPWQLYANGVRLIALRALADPAAADDVAHEAIARAMSALASRSGEIGDLRAFIYGIARHLIADAHRAAKRTLPIDSIPELPAPAIDALDATIGAEDWSRVHAAIRNLSERDRDLIELFFVEGLAADAVAVRLGDTPVNIRKRKSRVLERVRRALSGHDSPPASTDS